MKIATKIPFLAVFEQTKRGEPHLHIVCRAPYIDQKLLSKLMAKYMDAPIVDIRRVKDDRGAAKYISKYLSKDAFKFEGVKRYWRSTDYIIEDIEKAFPPQEFLCIIRKRYNAVMEDIGQTGITVADTMQGWTARIAWWHHEFRRC